MSFLGSYQTPVFLGVTGLWGSGKVSLLASQILAQSLQLATIRVSCFTCFQVPTFRLQDFFLYFQHWFKKRETSFLVNKGQDHLLPFVHCLHWYSWRTVVGAGPFLELILAATPVTAVREFSLNTCDQMLLEKVSIIFLNRIFLNKQYHYIVLQMHIITTTSCSCGRLGLKNYPDQAWLVRNWFISSQNRAYLTTTLGIESILITSAKNHFCRT